MIFLDDKDCRFQNFRKTLDTWMKQLASYEKDVKVRQADPNTPVMEDHLVMLSKLLGFFLGQENKNAFNLLKIGQKWDREKLSLDPICTQMINITNCIVQIIDKEKNPSNFMLILFKFCFWKTYIRYEK